VVGGCCSGAGVGEAKTVVDVLWTPRLAFVGIETGEGRLKAQDSLHQGKLAKAHAR
jgi:hypothetical protein